MLARMSTRDRIIGGVTVAFFLLAWLLWFVLGRDVGLLALGHTYGMITWEVMRRFLVERQLYTPAPAPTDPPTWRLIVDAEGLLWGWPVDDPLPEGHSYMDNERYTAAQIDAVMAAQDDETAPTPAA
jgi:hypothetical protein